MKPEEIKTYVKSVTTNKGIRPRIYYEVVQIVQHNRGHHLVIVDDNQALQTHPLIYFSKK